MAVWMPASTQTFTIQIAAVNDAPHFTKGSDQTVLEDSGTTSIANGLRKSARGRRTRIPSSQFHGHD
jgi:hypothetical protein